MVAKSEELSTDDPYEQIICFMEHASNVVTRMIHRNSELMLFMLLLILTYIIVCVILVLVLVSFLFALYKEIIEDVSHLSIERNDIDVQLSGRSYVHPIGIVKDVEVFYGRTK